VSFCSKNSLENVDTDRKLILTLWLNILCKCSSVIKFCSRHTVACLRSHVPEFTEPENWPPNSPDLNPVDYSVWEALQQMVYRHKISDIDQLKCALIDCWAHLSQDMLNRAIDQLSKRLVMVIRVKGAHVEFRLD